MTGAILHDALSVGLEHDAMERIVRGVDDEIVSRRRVLVWLNADALSVQLLDARLGIADRSSLGSTHADAIYVDPFEPGGAPTASRSTMSRTPCGMAGHETL